MSVAIGGSSSDESLATGRGLYFFGGPGFGSMSPQVKIEPLPIDAADPRGVGWGDVVTNDTGGGLDFVQCPHMIEDLRALSLEDLLNLRTTYNHK